MAKITQKLYRDGAPLKFWFHITAPPQGLWFHLENSEKKSFQAACKLNFVDFRSNVLKMLISR